jgi:hypothetical protein
MSSRTITLLGYTVIIASGVTLGVATHLREMSVPTFGTMVRWALRTRSGRIGVFAAWAWMGLHFLG